MRACASNRMTPSTAVSTTAVRRVMLAQRALGFADLLEQLRRVAVLGLLLLQRGLDLSEFERRGDGEDLRQQRPERTGGEDRCHRGCRLDDALDAVDRDPERVDRQ